MEKLYDAELRLMEIIWEHEPVCAKDIGVCAARQLGWNKNTTYTVLNKLAAKGAISRTDPGFICTPLCTREEVLYQEIDTLVERFCWGSAKQFFSAFVASRKLSWWELDELVQIIAERREAALNAEPDDY